jgi:hypothetical protein
MVQICVRSGQLPNLGANIQLAGRLLLLRARLLSLLLVGFLVLVVAGMVVLGMGQRLDDKIVRYRWQTLDTFRSA